MKGKKAEAIMALHDTAFKIYVMLLELADENDFVSGLSQAQLCMLFNEEHGRGMLNNSFSYQLNKLRTKRLIDYFKSSQPYSYFINTRVLVLNRDTNEKVYPNQFKKDEEEEQNEVPELMRAKNHKVNVEIEPTDFDDEQPEAAVQESIEHTLFNLIIDHTIQEKAAKFDLIVKMLDMILNKK
jgi:hypothetical protein